MLLICYFLLINIFCFAVYGIDKLCAVKGKARVPERDLIFLSVIGGAFGAFAAMKIFHHKTQKKRFFITVPILCVMYLVFIGFCLFQNYRLVTTEYDIVCSKLPDNGTELRIIQISDLHNQFFGFDQKLLLDKIAEQRPDMITVTGDTIDSVHTNYTLALEFMQRAAEIAPTYFITGNHEKWLIQKDSRYESFVDSMEQAGVIMLDDTSVCTQGCMIAGVSDASLSKTTDEINSVLAVDDDSLPFILLAHEPKYYDKYIGLGADIVLTGHVHGGQFIIPNKGGFISPEFDIFPELYEGKHIYKRDGGETVMVISRGLGNSAVPVRINNYPEIVLIKIRGEQRSVD